ncbi:MAG: A/G-specific adenine glycosylase [Desulfobulbaceae bacterium]|nr:MAG: A/G-specific adenine glycosylase [Desulfobulbaceae bacterium]
MKHRRPFAWRDVISPYRVFISEVMLQQTQTTRVIDKFALFLSVFPDFATLAQSPFSEVLRHWKGLGYNRRARFLHDSAAIIVEQFDGELPADPEILERLPGIGPATAASICVFAFDMALSFVETNIRTVYLYHFFGDQENVSDRELLSFVSATVDHERPREWYYALMDYGVMLKKSVGNLNRKSRHYVKQSKFEGSDRQVRGRILELLLEHDSLSVTELVAQLTEPAERVQRLIDTLAAEQIVQYRGQQVLLA